MPKKFATVEERRAYYREAAKKSYWRHIHDPGVREKTRANALRTYERNKARAASDPDFAETWRANNCERSKRHYHRHRTDPTWWANYLTVSGRTAAIRQRRYRDRHGDEPAFIERRRLVGRVTSEKYRALHKRAEGTFTAEEWEDRLIEFEGCCAFCLRPMSKPTVEHMRALSRGGTNHIENVIPACQSCNSRKRDRGMLWMASRIAA